MITFKARDFVTLPDGRTGMVSEVDIENRKAKCAKDPTNPKAFGPSATAWFDFDELRLRATPIPD
jgi:hypothetical protein